jgi:4-coumarate--CoA ligase (photoactive yellow protein activation family)
MTTQSVTNSAAGTETDDKACLSPGAIRRLCVDLISAEQDRLIREKRLSERHHIARLIGAPAGNVAAIEIGEDALGLDSLARLDLVGSLSRFFCLADTGAEDLLLVHRELGDWVRIVGAHLDRVAQAARFGFETSGSTGAPKVIAHARRVLDDEVREILETILCEHPAERFLTTVPPRHIYGFLWGVLLPERGGQEVIECHRSTGEALFRLCRPGDIVIGTPFTWERAARLGQRLAGGVTGITSGGPSTAATWEAAHRLGLDRLVEIYGSTETGGIGWRNRRDAPFHLSDRVERTGPRLRRRADRSVVPLQDHLLWRGAGRFDVAGRIDDVVQIAGTNVSTSRVARLLGAVDGVAEAAVRLDAGRMKALIVPSNPDGATGHLEEALRARAARHLDAPARPDRYMFASAMPRNAMGKLADW